MTMTTNEVFEELTGTWMNNQSVANLYGFSVGSRFDDVYSKVSLLRLIFWVVSYVVALKETSLEDWKKEVQSVAEETHYGTSAWWVAKCKAWQEGDALTIVDGKVDYAQVDASKRVVTAAAVNVVGRTLRLKVAKGESGNLSGLSTAQLQSLTGYVEAIKPMGLMVSVTSGGANVLNIYGKVRYSGELMKADVQQRVKAAMNEMLMNLEFNGTLYSGRMIRTIVDVDGVEDVYLTRMTMDGVEWKDSVVPTNGYATLNIDELEYEAI